MAEAKTSDNQKLSSFMKSGIYRFEGSTTVFVDPVRVLNLSYTHFRVSPSSYYSRFFQLNPSSEDHPRVSENQRKRKRKVKKPRVLNEREQLADERHQRVKPLLMKAHECLLGDNDLLLSLGQLRIDDDRTFVSNSMVASDEQSLVELGSLWQAPLFEISLHLVQDCRPTPGCISVQSCERRNIQAFGNLVVNETNSDMEADFLNGKYIIPKQSSFYMSDLKQIHGLIPGKVGQTKPIFYLSQSLADNNKLELTDESNTISYCELAGDLRIAFKWIAFGDATVYLWKLEMDNECGFKVIVVDPPWENGSANQKLKYPTLPNRYFLSLPIKRLAHADGALVALWVTNKEKLRIFVEKDLFPKWGVKHMATHYWLKVKADGSLISELDLFHHRPYECLVLGYCYGKDEDSEYFSKLKSIPECQVFISIPGDYSRKPPIGEMLREYIPGLEPARCLELFARELLGGWTSWGNEPLRFQDSRYFSRKDK